MSREVKLRIRGVQPDTDSDEPIEVVTMGQMHMDGDTVCIDYEEVVDEDENGVIQTIDNLLKISKDQVEIIKDGVMNSHMVFIAGQATCFYYSTPAGEIEVRVNTHWIQKKPTKTGFRLRMQYDLELNQITISTCHVDVEVEE